MYTFFHWIHTIFVQFLAFNACKLSWNYFKKCKLFFDLKLMKKIKIHVQWEWLHMVTFAEVCLLFGNPDLYSRRLIYRGKELPISLSISLAIFLLSYENSDKLWYLFHYINPLSSSRVYTQAHTNTTISVISFPTAGSQWMYIVKCIPKLVAACIFHRKVGMLQGILIGKWGVSCPSRLCAGCKDINLYLSTV